MFLGFDPRMSDFSWFSPNFVLLVRILVRARGRKKSWSCDKKISIEKKRFFKKYVFFIENSIRATQNAIVHPYNPLGPGERSLPSWEFFQKSASLWSLQWEIICRSHCPSEGSWPPVRTDIKLYEWILRIFGAGGRYILELWDETCRKRAPGFVLSISNVYATFCVHMNKRGLGQDAKTCSKARWYPVADLLANTAFSTKFRWKIKKNSKIHLKNMKKQVFEFIFYFFVIFGYFWF